jgi:MFS family permease
MNKKIFLTLLITFIPLLSYTALIPTYALYLESTLSVSASFAGYLMGINAVAFTLTAPVIGWLS